MSKTVYNSCASDKKKKPKSLYFQTRFQSYLITFAALAEVGSFPTSVALV